MSNTQVFHWGEYVDVQSFSRRPVLKDGNVLFTIRHGQVEFPSRDLLTLPFSSISTIGYLDVSPPTYTISLPNVVSEDGVEFEAEVAVKLELKGDANNRAQAAKSASRLSGEIANAVARAITPHFKRLEYKRIFRKEPEVTAEMFDLFCDSARHRLPYIPEGITLLSVVSPLSDVDAALRRETSTTVAYASDRETQRIRTEQYLENQRFQRNEEEHEIDHQHNLENRRRDHRSSLGKMDFDDELERRKLQADAEREIFRDDQLNVIDLDRVRLEDKVKHITELYKGLDGAEKFYMANTHPELYADIQKAEALSQIEMNTLFQQLMLYRAEQAGEHKILKNIANRLNMGLTHRNNFYYENLDNDEKEG